MQESYYRQDYLKTLADKFDNFVQDDPNLFDNESPKQIQRVLKEFGEDIMLLKDYPKLSVAIYTRLDLPIPEELVEEQKIQQSLQNVQSDPGQEDSKSSDRSSQKSEGSINSKSSGALPEVISEQDSVQSVENISSIHSKSKKVPGQEFTFEPD